MDLDSDRQSHDRNMTQFSMRDREKNVKEYTGGPDCKKCFVRQPKKCASCGMNVVEGLF